MVVCTQIDHGGIVAEREAGDVDLLEVKHDVEGVKCGSDLECLL